MFRLATLNKPGDKRGILLQFDSFSPALQLSSVVSINNKCFYFFLMTGMLFAIIINDGYQENWMYVTTTLMSIVP